MINENSNLNSFLNGFASLDLNPTLNFPYQLDPNKSDFVLDSEALFSDWQITGNDISRAIKTYDTTRKENRAQDFASEN